MKGADEGESIVINASLIDLSLKNTDETLKPVKNLLRPFSIGVKVIYYLSEAAQVQYKVDIDFGLLKMPINLFLFYEIKTSF